MLNIPEKAVIPLKSARIQIESSPLNYALEHEAAIITNWATDKAANPALFDGPFFMAEQAGVVGGAFNASYSRTRFATMMHWKKSASSTKPWHIFAVGVIVSGDNKLIAGRMAASTSAAGRVYFPAGSFDDGDVIGDTIDIDGNMQREVKEETGVDLAQAGSFDDQIHLVTANRSIALFRRYYFDIAADELLRKIRDHIASEIDSELDDVTAISVAGEMGDATPLTFRAFGDWHFSA